MPKSTKLREILSKLNVIKDPHENNVLLNLTKIPKQEPKDIQPTTKAGKENVVDQADLLYLPDDDGYKYLLVCVDIATRKIDCEPLKRHDAKTVRDALKKIYARKIIKQPIRLEVDDGSEFKGEFKKYFQKILTIITKVAHRSRQQAVVESKNGVIGEVLNTAMLGDEVNNDATSKKWVYLLKDMVKILNEQYGREPKITSPEAAERTINFTKDILPEGTKVRIQLDKPLNYVDGKPEIGSFRKGDVRWSKKVGVITRFFLRPDQPPLYQVDNDNRVAYSRYQLQIVGEDEVQPTIRDGAQQYAQEITGKRKHKGIIQYEVKWENGDKSWEDLKSIKDDLKEMIQEYLNKNKK